MKQEKIKISDVYWAHIINECSTTLLSVTLNIHATEFKNLSTGEIYPMKDVLGRVITPLGETPIGYVLKKAISDNLDVQYEQIYVETSSSMLHKYGRGIVPYLSNRTLNKYGNYLAKHQSDSTKTNYITSCFCEKHSTTPSEYAKMAKVFTYAINKKCSINHKPEIKERKHEDNTMSF